MSFSKPRLRTFPAARAMAATCTIALGGLAISAAAQADPPCPPGARCGSVTVPLDRARPSTGTLDIAYAVLPRTDTSRPALGTIVPNPGGPGSGAIAQAADFGELLAPLRRRRDILLIDPRGTGQSGALGCPQLAAKDPLSLDLASIVTTCGAELGARAGLYGSAAVADDFEAVRAALGVQKLDLWGQSYGTFLMPVYAARHPRHVRSMVLSGAYPIAFDPWGRDLLRGVRRSIGLVCQRTHACSGPRVLDNIGRLVQRLRRHPVPFTAPTSHGPIRLSLGEREVAEVTYGGGDPAVYGLLPAAVDAALDHDYAPLERLAATARLWDVAIITADPSIVSFAALAATSCHDYPEPFDRTVPVGARQAEYDRALAAIDPAAFRPFSAGAWFQSGIQAGPACLGWPADATAGSPLTGTSMPDVPVLVQSGDLDTNTPIEQGRQAAAQFAHATFAVIANAGHTPDAQPCGAAMGIDFVTHLRTNPDRCLHAGEPPAVAGRPARRAANLPPVAVPAGGSVRRAIAVALATVADAHTAAAIARLPGPVAALRGGTYVLSEHGVRYQAARVVTDAIADGTQRLGRRSTRTRLRLRGLLIELVGLGLAAALAS